MFVCFFFLQMCIIIVYLINIYDFLWLLHPPTHRHHWSFPQIVPLCSPHTHTEKDNGMPRLIQWRLGLGLREVDNYYRQLALGGVGDFVISTLPLQLTKW